MEGRIGNPSDELGGTGRIGNPSYELGGTGRIGNPSYQLRGTGWIGNASYGVGEGAGQSGRQTFVLAARMVLSNLGRLSPRFCERFPTAACEPPRAVLAID